MQMEPPTPKKSPSNFRWYLPTIHGDIRLEREGPKLTLLRAFELTTQEQHAMGALRTRALSTKWGRKPWAEEKDFLPVSHATYRTTEGLTLHLRAPIEDVQEALAKGLKPQRKLITAVRFTDGHIEEAFSTKDSEDGQAKVIALPVPEKPELEKYWEDLRPEKAATVAAPVVGCPMPAFAEAEVRASHVLEQFLNDEQIEDYRKHGCFVTTGHDSGRRYMVIHRERPAMIKRYGGRQLFDLEQDYPLCIHDWEVPPAEEMLALHLLLQLPGKEHYIRHLPEINEGHHVQQQQGVVNNVVGTGINTFTYTITT